MAPRRRIGGGKAFTTSRWAAPHTGQPLEAHSRTDRASTASAWAPGRGARSGRHGRGVGRRGEDINGDAPASRDGHRLYQRPQFVEYGRAPDGLDVAARAEVVAGARSTINALGDELQARHVPRQEVHVRSGRAPRQAESAALNDGRLAAAFLEARDGHTGVVTKDADPSTEVHELEGGLEGEDAAEGFAVGLLRHVPALRPRANEQALQQRAGADPPAE
jgi:hypothetical protein